MNKNIGQRYLSGFFWSFSGNIAWRSFSMVTTILIARFLGSQLFGILSMVRSTVDLFANYSGLRLGSTANRYIALYYAKEPDKAARILKLSLFTAFVVCCITSIVYMALSRYLAGTVLGDKSYTNLIIISAFFMFFHVYSGILESALAGFESFKEIAKITILRGVLTPCLCLPATYLFGIEGFFIALAFISLIVLLRLVQRINIEKTLNNFPESIPMKSLKNEIPVLWSFALPGFISGLIISSLWWYGRLLVTQSNDGYVELGHFAAANQWRNIIIFLPAIFSRVALPILSETHGSNAKNFGTAVAMQFQANCVIILPLTVLVIAFSDLLAKLFGKGYAGAEDIIPILMLSVFFDIFSQSLRNIFDSAGRRWTNLIMHVISSTVYITSCRIFIPSSGAVGLAFSLYIFFCTLFCFQLILAEIFITPLLIKRIAILFLYSLLIVSCCYLIKVYLPKNYANPIFLLLLILSSIPLLRRVKNYLKTRKDRRTSDPLLQR